MSSGSRTLYWDYLMTAQVIIQDRLSSRNQDPSIGNQCRVSKGRLSTSMSQLPADPKPFRIHQQFHSSQPQLP